MDGLDESLKAKCTADHTRIYEGECVCEEGYVSDNPLGKRGCWLCDPRCHSTAECIYPGHCQCIGGYLGNGVTACSPPVPRLLSVAPGKSTTFFGPSIKANYSTSSTFTPFMAFCSFNGTVAVGAINEDSSISCLIPDTVTGETAVSVSFDGVSFSNAKSIIIDTQESPKLFTKQTFSEVYNPEKEEKGPRIGFRRVLVIFLSVCLGIVAFWDSYSPLLSRQLAPFALRSKNVL